ncbi:MAG TPA: LysE family translocator [Methanosarcinales archaeon]|nr:LysE family translocator [Methanosarcinales archaeon]
MIELLAIGFAIGLTGAVVPGPMLFATIEASLRKGWIAGLMIVLGHVVVEILICTMIFLGFSIANDIVFNVVSLVGGGALIIFGMMTIHSSRNATFDVKGGIAGSPVVAGTLTSVSNPYFLIWWLTIGNSMVMDGLKIGFIAAALFITGHWIADMVWYVSVSTISSSGGKLMSDLTYRAFLSGCGVFLVCFGIYYATAIVI